MFNGNVKTPAQVVVCPLNPEDVSKLVHSIFRSCPFLLVFRIVLFCSKHSLSPSVKAGGYGTAGWAVNGDIIIDLSRLADLGIETPREDGSFTSLRDVPSLMSKGKKSVNTLMTDTSITQSGKQRRDDDVKLRNYSSASLAVAQFLGGAPLPPDNLDTPRRIIWLDHPHQSGQQPVEEPSGGGTTLPHGASATDEGQHASSMAGPFGYLGEEGDSSTVPSSSPAGGIPHVMPPQTAGTSPFSYLSDVTNDVPPPQAPPAQTGHSLTTWGEGTNSLFANTSLASHALLEATARPAHSHAYVTFGAGVRQKEIDSYTAANPLPATSVSGLPCAIPYHVPL
jgi:hypothetical protein